MNTQSVTYRNVLSWDDATCLAVLERKRWPDGHVCPHCGIVETPYKIKRKSKTKNKVRTIYQCKSCKKQFTVTVGTIFEGSHIPLSIWFAAIFDLCQSKKGISAHQVHRKYGITYKSALFMCHRIRSAMRNGVFDGQLKGEVEADATFVGGKYRRGHETMYERINDEISMGLRTKDGTPKVHGLKGKRHPRTIKTPVLGILERGGNVRTVPLERKDENATEIRPLLRENIESDARLITDGHSAYRTIEREMRKHDVINHEEAYVCGDIHTNNIEGYWSLLKRGIVGTFHHVSRHRLPMYLGEFEYRFNHRDQTDADRFENLLSQTEGRLRWNFRQ